MRRVLQSLVNNAVPLFYAKDAERKVRLSGNVVILSAQFIKLYCAWRRSGDCRNCPFLQVPEGFCALHIEKPHEWELLESSDL